VTAYLVDTSALGRVGRSAAVAQRVADLRRSGALWTCDVVSLELGHSARDAAEWAALSDAQARLPQAPVDAAVMARAVEVQGDLARRGHHRVSLPDLVIAAAAEGAEVAILHYDRDFTTIAQATAQPVEWVVRPGSID
jgi:predicted nucleic acid-binding protein